MAQLLQPETETTDPRILRSRRMLMEALARLLTKKEFEDLSVQEISDEATLNRATFYLHYADKNALLHAMTEFRFRDLIERRAITFTDCNGALRAIALGVCDYLAESTGCPTQLSRMALEGSIIPIVEDMFKEGLARCRCGTAGDHCGLGRFWSRAPLVPDPQPYPRRGDGRQD
jgi:AcrR family transcriptional regulator